ncbi:MAG: hypothetical protein ACE5QF_09900 [Thermoplasmata archaeon]
MARPLCGRTFRSKKQEDQAWNRETFRYFYKRGLEYFKGFDRHDSYCEVLCSSGHIKEIDPKKYEAYEKRFGDKVSHWLHEYLVDLCWRIWDRDSYHLELALEVEWSPSPLDKDWGEPVGEDDMEEDVYKLLDVRAPMKIGILGCSKAGKEILKSEDQEKLTKYFASYVRFGNHLGESFLLMFVDDFNDGGVNGYLVDEKGNYDPLPRVLYRNLG